MAPKALKISTPGDYVGTLLEARQGDGGLRRAARTHPRRRHRRGREARRQRASSTTRCSTKSRPWSNGRCRWPGRFEEQFLELPREVPIATHAGAPALFPGATTPQGRLMPWFITVANIESRDPAQVRRRQRARRAAAPHRRRVLLPDQDRQQPLAAQIDALTRVTFQAQLGSQRRQDPSASRALADAIAARDRRRHRARRPRRAARQVRPADEHGRRVPRAAGHHGAVLRAARRRAGGSRRGAARALPAALRGRRAAGDAHRHGARASPTSSTRSPASSRPGRSPPARAIRSACVVPRSACCASRSSASSISTCSG